MAHAFMVGGAEEIVLNLVRHLPARFEPMVCCIHEAGPIGDEIRKTGTPVAVLGLNPGMRRPRDLGGIRRYLREAQPQIVHTFLLTASLYGRLAAILERVPIVIGTEVNMYADKKPHHAMAERLLMWGTDRVIASAEAVREFYIRQIHADPAMATVRRGDGHRSGRGVAIHLAGNGHDGCLGERDNTTRAGKFNSWTI